MRVALWVFGIYVASERAIPHPCHFEEARNGWAAMPLQYSDGALFKLVGIWERWDACWYARIATFGYSPDGSTAFFPLFPTLERIVALGSAHVVIAGMIINLVATTLALWGIYRIALADHSERVARRTILLVSIFPTALFLLAPFSEATFLALATWTIERARRGEWIAAALLATLAGLSRPVGLFLALPLAWLVWRQWRQGPARERAWPVIAALAAPASAVLYVVYTARAIGRSMFDASADWTGSAFHPPWDLFDATLGWIARTGDPLQALQLALNLMIAALFVVGIRRLPFDLTLYSAPHVYLVWARILPTPLTSTSRYLLVVFPAFIVLAMLLGDRRARWSYAILSLLLLGALAGEVVIGNFVG